MPGNRYTQLCCLEGSTPEDGSGASHQAKDIVVAPAEPFFTANGSYFVFCGLRRSCRAGLGVTALGCCQDSS